MYRQSSPLTVAGAVEDLAQGPHPVPYYPDRIPPGPERAEIGGLMGYLSIVNFFERQKRRICSSRSECPFRPSVLEHHQCRLSALLGCSYKVQRLELWAIHETYLFQTKECFQMNGPRPVHPYSKCWMLPGFSSVDAEKSSQI